MHHASWWPLGGSSALSHGIQRVMTVFANAAVALEACYA